MSTVNVTAIESRTGGAPAFSQGLSVGGVDIKTLAAVTEYHTGSTQPTSTANGALWWDGTNLRQYIAGLWLSLTVSGPVVVGDRGVVAGNGAGTDNAIQYWTISLNGSASDFGDLTVGRQRCTGCSDGSRGVVGGGYTGGGSTNYINNIDYITISTTGNALDFGDLTTAQSGKAAVSGASRGVFGGGSPTTNGMEYITFANTGNATDFGDLNTSPAINAGLSDAIRGVFSGGVAPSRTNVMDYITIATTGNATDFGDMTTARYDHCGCGNSTRGLFAGGSTSGGDTRTIDYITTSTTGNATDFGDLVNNSKYLGKAACCNKTKAVFAGGYYSNSTTDYVSIDTAGNAVSGSSLQRGTHNMAGLSGD